MSAPKHAPLSAVATEVPSGWVGLFRAAPEMELALLDVASAFDSMREEDGYEVPPWLKSVRAAIAKARGQP